MPDTHRGLPLEHYFSPDYLTARDRFRAAAHRAGAQCQVLPLSAAGAGGEALSIDIACVGSRQPRRALVYTSGLHGVEAYAGAAIQLALLESLPELAPDDALIVVHVLNPYGMAWLRRTNENNVDLNRNFLADTDQRTGAHALYRKLEHFLNPRSAPGADAFLLRAAGYTLRFGFHPIKQAIAEGQYEFPRGLFYGGKDLEEGPRLYLAWLAAHCAGVEQLLALDVHTGLGPRGRDTLLVESAMSGTSCRMLEGVLGRPVIDPARGRSDAYMIRGGLGGALYRIFARASTLCILQEFGTYGPLRVLHALREENRCHFFGGALVSHPAKQRLRETLCPHSRAWRRQVVHQGLAVAHALSRWLFRKDAS
jgi:uncharacterized protein DUF2817